MFNHHHSWPPSDPSDDRHLLKSPQSAWNSAEMNGWLRSFWDTTKDGEPTPWCLYRLQRELAELHADPPPGVYVAPEENDMTTLHAVIVGPWGTPLEGGLFHLQLRYPPDYPMVPPIARFMTDEDNVSFSSHVNGGSICLSLLCTAPGPSWSPALTISSLLVSIQSLMTDDAEESARHDTVRVAVCGTLEDCLQETSPTMPPALSKQVLKYFAENYTRYEDAVEAQISSGKVLSWIMGNGKDYEPLLKRLRDIKKRVDERNRTADGQQNGE
nr:ubiquitin-conjugating enzyme E2 Z-like [Dermacentor andersoni]